MTLNYELIKKKFKKGTALALVTSTILSGNIQAIAIEHDNSQVVSEVDDTEVKLKVKMGVNLYLDDKGFVPRDANGNETYPFICDGTTYVPIRAIADLFDASIIWKPEENAVYIGTSGHKANIKHTKRAQEELYNMSITATSGVKLYIDGKEVIPKDVNGNIKDIYIVNGTTYVPIRAVSDALQIPIVWSEKSNSIFIGNHKTYGITVENINDPETFNYYATESLNIDNGLYLEFDKETETAKSVSLRNEMLWVAAVFNKDYIEEENLNNLLSNLKPQIIDNYNYFVNQPLLLLNENKYFPDKTYPFNWNLVLIDEAAADYMCNLQLAIYQYNANNDVTALKNLIVDYFKDDILNFNHDRGYFYTDYMTTNLIYHCKLSNCQEFKNIDLYSINNTSRYDLRQNSEEIKNIYLANMYQKNKVK